MYLRQIKGLSAIELANELEINYKTAFITFIECRILMPQSNSKKKFWIAFFIEQTLYIGSK